MLKLKKGSLLSLTIVTGALLTSLAAIADGGVSSPKNDREDITGRCRFQGVFSDTSKDKNGGTFSVNCRARLEFDKRDLFDRDRRNASELNENDRDRRDRDRFELECDGEEVYDDGLRIHTKKDRDHDWDMSSGRDRDRGLDAIFSGRGSNAPRIFVEDIKLDRDRHDVAVQNDNDHDDRGRGRKSDATLTFSRWGYSYTLPGFCRFEEDKDRRESLK